MRFLRTRVVRGAVSLGAGALLALVGPVAGKWDNPVCVAVSTVFLVVGRGPVKHSWWAISVGPKSSQRCCRLRGWLSA